MVVRETANTLVLADGRGASERRRVCPPSLSLADAFGEALSYERTHVRRVVMPSCEREARDHTTGSDLLVCTPFAMIVSWPSTLDLQPSNPQP